MLFFFSQKNTKNKFSYFLSSYLYKNSLGFSFIHWYHKRAINTFIVINNYAHLNVDWFCVSLKFWLQVNTNPFSWLDFYFILFWRFPKFNLINGLCNGLNACVRIVFTPFIFWNNSHFKTLCKRSGIHIIDFVLTTKTSPGSTYNL